MSGNARPVDSIRTVLTQAWHCRAFLASTVLILACTDPIGTIHDLRIDFRVVPNIVEAGDSMTAKLVIINPAANSVTISSGSSCVATLDALSNEQRVDLDGTAFGCLAVVSYFVIPPRDSLVRTFVLVAMLREQQSPWRYVIPPPSGLYHMRARVQVGLPDQTVDFQVTP
jgi:hypothetical protein